MAIFNPFNITPYSLCRALQKEYTFEFYSTKLEEAIKEFNDLLLEHNDSWTITQGHLTGVPELSKIVFNISTIFFGNRSEWELYLPKEEFNRMQHALEINLIRLHPNWEVVKKFYQISDLKEYIEERNFLILDYLRNEFNNPDYNLPQFDSWTLSKAKIDDRIIIYIDVKNNEYEFGCLTEDRFKNMDKLWEDTQKGNPFSTSLSRYGYPQVLLISTED